MALTDKLSAIGDAIRTKSGKTEKLTLDEMPAEIGGLSENLDAELTEQENLIDTLQTSLENKMIGGGSVEPKLQEAEATPTESEQTLTPESGYDGFSKVTIHPIPDGYIQPSGSVEITENGTIDVTQYASATVNVAGGSSEPDPRDQYQRVEYITSAEEGTYPYIITDIYADNDTGVEVIASFETMQDRIPMGSRLDSSSTRFYVTYPLSTSSCYYGFNIGSSISCSTKINTIYRLQTNFMNSRQAIIYEENGNRKAFANFTQTLSKHTVPISIFGYNSASSGVVSSKREYKLYSARISEGFDIIREYIPCYRKRDGVVGLYEKFTGQFLTAEEGEFTKGADKEW
jgi:hypothetical protein